MTGLYILCGVILFFLLILFVPIGVELSYDGEFAVALRVLFFRYRLIPKKKKKIRLRKFSKKRYEKMLAREKRKAEKKAAKKAAKDAKKKAKKEAEKAEREKAEAAGKKKRGAMDIVSDLWDMRSLIVRTIRGFVGRVRTERVKIKLVIGSDNAAQSALIYGAASNVAVDMQEILRTQTNLRRECEIDLGVDFTSDTTVADVYVRMAVTIAGIMATGIGFIVGFVRQKIKQS